MLPINMTAEEVVLDMLQTTGPCYLDDLVIQLPSLSWSEVFVAVDRMSRDGRLFLRRLARSTYYVALPSWHASPRSPSCHRDPRL
jgi:hypothetical protein